MWREDTVRGRNKDGAQKRQKNAAPLEEVKARRRGILVVTSTIWLNKTHSIPYSFDKKTPFEAQNKFSFKWIMEISRDNASNGTR